MQASTSSSGRVYTTPNGDKYPSITTILGAGEKQWLEDWRQSLGPVKAQQETQRCADRGEAVHSMVERFLNNDPSPTNGFQQIHIAQFNALRLMLKKINNIHAQEIPLYSDILKVAGRVDCIGEWDGVLSIIDFKTSNTNKSRDMIENYFLQATAYALMYHEMYDIQIDQIVILCSVERGVVPLVFKEPVEKHIEPLVVRVNQYYNGLHK